VLARSARLLDARRLRWSFAEASCSVRNSISARSRHPSLRAKKYEERTGLWQVRINDDWRMYFTIEGDAYVLRAITPHPK
jgi:plasmid maintenance system killer protein